MKISADIGWGHKFGGARRLAIKTLMAMSRISPKNEYLAYSNSAHADLTGTAVHERVFPAPRYVPQSVWDQFVFPHAVFPEAVRRDNPDVIYFTNNIMSFGRLPAPAVVSILDMTPFVIPGSYRYLHGAYQRMYFRYAVKAARKIITISESSKKDICRFLDVDGEKVTVIPLASDIALNKDQDGAVMDALRAKFALEGRFILYVGAVHPRKNIFRLIEAFGTVVSSGQPHSLVIAGSIRWGSSQLSPEKIRRQYGGRVIFTGGMGDKELASLYSNCDVFVYPSVYEGFGLPVLEAMSLGAPVVTSRVSSMPEVAGDAALFVDPYDTGNIAAAIMKILESPDLAEDLRKKGFARASRFSWETTASKVLEVLESVAGGMKR